MNLGTIESAANPQSFCERLGARKKDIKITALAVAILGTAAAVSLSPIFALALTGGAAALGVTFIALRYLFGPTGYEVVWVAPEEPRPPVDVSTPADQVADQSSDTDSDESDSAVTSESRYSEFLNFEFGQE